MICYKNKETHRLKKKKHCTEQYVIHDKKYVILKHDNNSLISHYYVLLEKKCLKNTILRNNLVIVNIKASMIKSLFYHKKKSF